MSPTYETPEPKTVACKWCGKLLTKTEHRSHEDDTCAFRLAKPKIPRDE